MVVTGRVVMGIVDEHQPVGQSQETPAVRVGEVIGGEDVGRRSVRDDATGQQHHMIRRGRLGQVVRRHHDGATGGALLVDDIEDAPTTDEIESGDRFVEQQQVARLGQPLRDEHALALSARQLVEVTTGEIGDLESFEGPIDKATIHGIESAERAPIGEATHRHRLPHRHGELLVDLGRLHDVGDASTDCGGLGPQHPQRPGPQWHESDDRVEEARLPCAVRSDERGDRAGRERERRGVEHGMGTMGEREVDGLDRDVSRHRLGVAGAPTYDPPRRQSCRPRRGREPMPLRVRRAAVFTIAVLAVQAAALLVTIGLEATPAAAHASVVATDPADGSSVSTAPTRVSVTFSESISTSVGGLSVRDGRGTRVDEGNATASGAILSTAVRPDLPSGTYVATYRVVSIDGHPVSGSFLFAVGTGAIDRTLATDTGDGAWEFVGYLSRTAVLIAGLLAAGTAFFLGFVHDGDEDRWRLVPVVRISTIIALLGAVGLIMTQAAILTGRGAGASTDTTVLRSVLSDDLGWASVLLLVGLAAVHLSTDVHRRVVIQTLSLYGGLGVTVSFALWGHATAFTPSWVLMFTDAVHATAAAVWFGGLVGLIVVLRRREPTTVGSTAGIVGRFSAMALWSVLALVVAGVVLAVAGSDASWHDLVTTTWGRLVIVKVVLTSGIIAIAAWNRRVLVPSIVNGVEPPVSDDRRRTRLRRAVGIEAIVIVGVLALTGALTEVTPARAAATRSTSFSSTRAVESGSLTLVVRPVRVGRTTIDATYTDATGQPADVGTTMTIEYSLPDEGLAPLVRRAEAVGPGHFVHEGNEFSLPGTWTVTLAVRTDEFTEQRTSFDVHIDP